MTSYFTYQNTPGYNDDQPEELNTRFETGLCCRQLDPDPRGPDANIVRCIAELVQAQCDADFLMDK